ncbi:MAG: hypothetical protein JW818_12100 [Pirellulales bacterium]|nr:hypothetical protein [Pirellulales bacterium]
MASTSPAATAPDRRIDDFAQGTTRGIWHKSAPSDVRQAARSGDPRPVWSGWTTHLAQRQNKDNSAAFSVESLLWAVGQAEQIPGTFRLLKRLANLAQRRRADAEEWEETASRWTAEAMNEARDPGRALEAIAWCRAIPRLAAVLSCRAWWDLLTFLVDTVWEAQDISPNDAPLAHQLLAGELAFELARRLPELTPCRDLVKQGRKAVALGLKELLDGNGLPQADIMELQRPLLACWTRCGLLGRHWKKGCFQREAKEQYEWAIRQAVRWTRPDGAQALAPHGPEGACEALFRAALKLDNDEEDRDVATLALPGAKKSQIAKLSRYTMPEAAYSSEWSSAAALRTDWHRTSPSLWVHYSGQTVRSELAASGRVLWSGPWQAQIRRDGRVLEPTSDWDEVCWVSDEDVDYLEIEIELTEGLLWQRQMLLAREDGFLWLADCILGDEPARLEYAGCLPLAPGVTWTPAAQTREGILTVPKPRSKKPIAQVLPLTLPEWQNDPHPGTLTRTDSGLELRQAADGRSLCAACFIDLDPRRMARKLTWRRLTVAESLEVQPDDVAVGQRVQIGQEQWLLYRSLAIRANRTLLGHNLSTETLVGRFDAGEVEPLLEVE